MTLAEERRAKFNDTFNRLLGNSIGKPNVNYQDAAYYDAIKNFVNLDPKSATTAPKTDSSGIADKLNQLTTVVQTPNNDSAWDTVKNGLMHAADIVARPSYAVNEGLRNMQESINKGEPFWSLGDDILWGMGQGAGGYRKTGYGDVVEEATNYNQQGKNWANKLAAGAWFGEDTPTGGQVLAELEQTHPAVAHRAKQGMGFLGEVALDPLNFVGGKVLTVSKETANSGGRAIIKGMKTGTVATGKDAVRQTVVRAINDALTSSPIKNVVTKDAANQFVKMSDSITDKVIESADKLMYEVGGGAQAGKVVYGREAARTIAQSAAETHRAARLSMVEPAVKTFTDSLSGAKQLSVTQLKSLRRNTIFDAFYKEFVRVRKTTTTLDDAVRKGWEAASRTLQAETDEIFAKAINGIQDEVLRIPTIKVFNKEIAAMPSVGKAFSAFKTKALNTHQLDVLSKGFNYGSNFPGYSTLISQKARALGVRNFEAKREAILKLAQGTTKADRIAIQKALESGTKLSGKLGVLQEQLRIMYDQLFLEEVAAGIRKNTPANKLEDYAYVFLKGSKKERDLFLDQRADAILQGRYKDFGSDAAKKAGLRPEEDAFKNLLYRTLKSNRAFTKNYFAKDLVTHYGIKGVASKGDSLARSLIEVPAKYLTDDLKRALKPGEKYFIDKDIQHIMEQYFDLVKVGSDSSNELLRAWDLVTRKFKTWNTIYYPAFHIRNFMSDMWMGWLDGVKYADYKSVMKGWPQRTNPNTFVNLGGETVRYSDVYHAFQNNASSGGFLSTELANSSKHFNKGVKQTLASPTSWPAGIRKFSEHREDFGRFAHFYHAMSEEFPKALRREKTREAAWDAAINASTFRVNKYKFDYGALTKVEQQFVRRGIPFYTYMRKAIPTLMEAVFLSPKVLSRTTRLFETMEPDSEDLKYGLLPDWMRESGFAKLTGGDEPLGVSANFLPTNALVDLTTNPAAMINPIIRSVFELSSGKDTYTGSPVNNPWDVVKNNIRLFRTADQLANEDMSGIEKTGRLTGIPFFNVTKERQEQALQSAIFELKGQITSINESLAPKGLKLYFSNRNSGASIRLKKFSPSSPDDSGKQIAEFSTLQEALDYLSRL